MPRTPKSARKADSANQHTFRRVTRDNQSANDDVAAALGGSRVEMLASRAGAEPTATVDTDRT